MNKSYKSVWNETTGTYVAASETAKGRGKSSRNQKALIAALLAAGVGFGTAVKSEAAATPNSFAVGILGTNPGDSDCISSADGAQVTTNGDCNAASQQAGIVSYDGSGAAGAYFTATDPNTAHIGAGGIDQLRITNKGLFVLNGLDMGGFKITNLAPGDVSASSKDAVNGSQLNMTNADVTTLKNRVDGITAITGSNLGVPHFRMTTGGADSVASGQGAIAIGTNSTASGGNSISVSTSGMSSTASGSASIVMGANNQAQDQWAIAIGADNAAATQASVAIGQGNNVRGVASIGIGQGASVSGVASIGIGQSASVTGNYSVALGQGSSTSRDKVVAVGGRQIANVTAGTQATDAINYAQLQAAGLKVDTSGNATNSFVAYDDTTMGKVTLGGESGTTLTNVAAGSAATDAVNVSQLQSEDAKVDQQGSTTAKALGGGAAYDSTTGIISAPSYELTNANSIDGTSSAATDVGTAFSTVDTALGKLNTAVAQNATDVSNLDTRVTTVEGSVSNLTNQINSGAVGLVQQDQTSGALTVASSTGGSSVDFTGTEGARELLGVAAGTTNNSAVNLGQLSPVVSSLGGGAQVNSDGSITGPTYHVQGGTQTTVGGALDTLDSGLSSLQTQISNGSIGIVTQDPTSRDLLVGASMDGLRVNMAGAKGNRVVTGVAAGTVGVESVDAVNGSQLYANAASTAAALGGGSSANADGTVSAPSYSVGGTTVYNVGAAITNIDGRVTQNTSDIASLQNTVGTMSGSVANAVSYDSSAHNQVTLGGSTSAAAVKLTNVQAGELSATSKDAVNGAQLWDTNQQLSNLTQSMQNQQQTGNSSMSVNNTSDPAPSATGSGAIAIGGGAQASGDNSVAIGAGSVADQANTVSVGSQGNERRITNLAPGQAPTDAVNLGQMQSAIGDTARAAYGGIAAATALTMIPEVDPGKTVAVGMAGATYKGYQAAAVGASARITQNLKIKIGAGVSGNETTVGAGASYQW